MEELNGSAQGRGMAVDIRKFDELECPVCASRHFAPTQIVKRVPALLSPNGQAGIAQMTIGVTCIQCGYFVKASDMLNGSANYVDFGKGSPAKRNLVEVEDIEEKAK